MPINAVKQQPFEQLAEGVYPARIYKIIHIGTANNSFGTRSNTAMISFEFPTELKIFDKAKGEQPMSLSQEYTLTFSEKANLRKLIDAVYPKALKSEEELEAFDIEALMGQACLVTVVHKTTAKGTYANIGGTTALPKGMTCPDQVNPSQLLNYDNFDEAFFNAQPKFIQAKIESSDEYKAMKGEENQDFNLDEIPF